MRKWTEQEDKILRHSYKNGTPIKKIAKSLHRTEYSIMHRARRVGIRHPMFWTVEEDKILIREHIEKGKPAKDVCKMLGRPLGKRKDGAALKERARRLGLKPRKERDRIRREFMKAHLRSSLNPKGLYLKDLTDVFGLCYGQIKNLAKKWNLSTTMESLPIELNPRAIKCYLCGKKHLNRRFCSRSCEAFPLFLIPKLWGIKLEQEEENTQ